MKSIPTVSLFLVSLFQFITFPGFSATVDFDPSLAISETYTDNLELDQTNPMEDWITLISPTFTAHLETETGELNFALKPEYSIYAAYPEYNTLRLSSSLSGGKKMSKRMELSFQNTFSRTEEPRAKEEDIEPDETRRGREPFNTNIAKLAAAYQFSKYGGLTAGYAHTILDNEDPEQEDRQSHNPSTGLVYWAAPNKMGIRLQFSYLRTEFSDDSETLNQRSGSMALILRISEHLEYLFQYGRVYTRFSGDTENYEVDEFMAGVDWKESRTIQVKAGFGFFQQTPESGEGVTGLMANLMFDKSGKHWQARISGDAGYTHSYLESENAAFDWFHETGCYLQLELSRRWESRFEAKYRQDIYEPEGVNRKDRLFQLYAGANYQVKEWLEMECGYEHRILNSNEDENDYTENRGEVKFSVYPSDPLRWFW